MLHGPLNPANLAHVKNKFQKNCNLAVSILNEVGSPVKLAEFEFVFVNCVHCQCSSEVLLFRIMSIYNAASRRVD